MIANITKGTGFRGCAEYLFNGTRGRQPERGQMIFSNMAGKTPRELANEWGMFRRLRPKLGKAVCHISLSLASEDKPLTDADWSSIAQRFIDELGFAECPYVAIRHDDTRHSHIHLLASRIDRNGNVVSDKRDFARAEKILRSIELDFRLHQVKSVNNKNNKENGKMDTTLEPTPEYYDNQETTIADLPRLPPAGGFAECGDEDLTEKKRRNYKRRLLEDAYSRQIAMMLAGVVRYVERKPGQLIIHTNEGGKIEDTGDKLTALNMPSNISAERIILLCISKGWQSVVLSGDDEFLKLAMRMALQRGLKVKVSGAHQLQILAEVETEVFVKESANPPHSLPSAPETETPINPVKQMTGLSGLADRMRQHNLNQSKPILPSLKTFRPK